MNCAIYIKYVSSNLQKLFQFLKILISKFDNNYENRKSDNNLVI